MISNVYTNVMNYIMLNSPTPSTDVVFN